MNSNWSIDCEKVVLCEILSLMWSYCFCASCLGAWEVVSDWVMGQIVMQGRGGWSKHSQVYIKKCSSILKQSFLWSNT